jgi:hypothetical protein
MTKFHESVSIPECAKATKMLLAAKATIKALTQPCTFPADIRAAEVYLIHALKED